MDFHKTNTGSSKIAAQKRRQMDNRLYRMYGHDIMKDIYYKNVQFYDKRRQKRYVKI